MQGLVALAALAGAAWSCSNSYGDRTVFFTDARVVERDPGELGDDAGSAAQDTECADGQIVDSSDECYQDDAFCRELPDGRYCTGDSGRQRCQPGPDEDGTLHASPSDASPKLLCAPPLTAIH